MTTPPLRHRPATTTPAFLAISCVGMFTSATAVMAQSSAQDAQAASPRLGGVVVTDTAVNDESYKVDQASSPKFTAPLVDTPRSVTVIPAQIIRDTASASLTEALRTVPGITLGAGEGGNPMGDRPFIRGFDSQASTYLDGVRDVAAQSREVFAVEQIEIVKGSDSSMGGRGSAGGSINLVTKVPTADRFVAASGALGNADYKRATLDINQPINDFVGVRVNGMWHDQDVAGRDAVKSKRWGVAPSVKIGLNGPTSLTFSYYHMEADELPDSGIPYLYTIANAPAGVTESQPIGDFTTADGVNIKTPRSVFYGLKNRDFRFNNTDNITIRAEHDFGNGIKLRNTSRVSDSKQGYVLTQPDDSQSNVYNTGQVWRRVNSRYSTAEGVINQTDLSGEFSALGMKHSFALSAEIAWEKATNGSYVSDPATGTAIVTSPRCTPEGIALFNCTTVVGANPNDAWAGTVLRSLPKTWTQTKVDSKGVSLFDTITLTDSLLINLGGRYDRYETTVSPGLAATSTADRVYVRRTDNLWNYQAGLVFKPNADSSIYISTSSSATPPGSFLAQGSEGNALNTTSQALTDALKIEKTKSYEIGTKWNLLGGDLALTFAAFRTETKNARAADENGTVAFIGERLIKGIEFGFNGNITPEWNVFGGYTYMDATIVDGGFTLTSGVAAPNANTGKRFPNTPKHSMTAFTTYQLTPAFKLGGGATYMSKVYGGYSDVRAVANGAVVISKELARSVPGYWRFDANASYAFNDVIQLQVNVLNVANKRYFDKAYSSHYANQAAGRTAIATLNIKY